jgi:hypothetical protein
MVRSGVVMFLIAVVILIGLVVLVLFGFYGKNKSEIFGNESEIGEEVMEEVEEFVNESEENVTGDDDFPDAEEIHWGHMPLTYKVNDKEKCEGISLEKMESAMKILEDKTENVVEFNEVDSDEVDLEINCVSGKEIFEGFGNNSATCEDFSFDYIKNQLDPVRENLIDVEDYLVNYSQSNSNVSADETVYEVCYIDSSNAVSANNYNGLKESEPVIEDEIVLKHEINIFVSGEGWNPCANFPAREMHELLHGFGFAHSPETLWEPAYGWVEYDLDLLKDVMFPERYCVYQKVLDDKYPSCLKRIYTGDEEENCGGVLFSPA